MLIKKRTGYEIPSSEITPEHLYRSRRNFIKGAALLTAGALAASCRPSGDGAAETTAITDSIAETTNSVETAVDTLPATDELGDPLNTFEQITNYNNFYEFTIDKEEVAKLSAGYVTTPWQVEVGGLVNNPGVYDVDNLRNDFDHEDRIYRLRCVEGWSMVIPWRGFTLAQLLQQVEPQANAKYVRFETVFDPDNMPGQKSLFNRFPWPYVEGLRLDEAMNDLTILATGMYGQDLLPANGAPIRLVVPWKYGFKSIKSIVKIDLVDEMPTSLWMESAPNEYGFYANVNPTVDHPRWSQASERRIGEFGRRETLMFNGYEEQVSSLYEDMDLRENF